MHDHIITMKPHVCILRYNLILVNIKNLKVLKMTVNSQRVVSVLKIRIIN